jgi:hypothetical protein
MATTCNILDTIMYCEDCCRLYCKVHLWGKGTFNLLTFIKLSYYDVLVIINKKVTC